VIIPPPLPLPPFEKKKAKGPPLLPFHMPRREEESGVGVFLLSLLFFFFFNRAQFKLKEKASYDSPFPPLLFFFPPL